MRPASHSAAAVEAAYRTMADKFRYRPARIHPEPNPTEAELTQEISDYIDAWFRDERTNKYYAGCPDFSDRETLIYVIEAARCINALRPDLARQLLLHAAQRLAPKTPTPIDL